MSELFHQLSEEDQREIVDSYVKEMNPTEKKTYEIAKEHLESSFSIEKSIGFIKYCEEELEEEKE